MCLLNVYVYIGFSEILNILSILPGTIIHIMNLWVLILGDILDAIEGKSYCVSELNVEAFFETIFK